jgi:hypothetical protein
MIAKYEFEETRNALMKFCETATDYVCEVHFDTYPLTVVFTPNPQGTIFDDNIDENGEIGELVIECGLDTRVKSTLTFQMDSALLKKFIKSAEKIAFLYYHAFREEAGDLRTRTEDGERENFRRMIDDFERENAVPPVDEKEREFQERLREVLGDTEGGYESTDT